MRRARVARFLLIALLLTSVATAAASEAQEGAEPADAAAEEVAEPVPLDCKPGELYEKVESWSVDCVAMWLETLGFAELKAAFQGNSIDGTQLRGITLERLADEYGVSDEADRKKIFYNLKDVIKKDEYAGNTNYYTQMLMWCLPFLLLGYWLSLKYEKQIARAMKKYHKWQEKRAPPKVAEPVIMADGKNEWISGVNSDMSGPKSKKEKREEKEARKEAKKKPAKVD